MESMRSRLVPVLLAAVTLTACGGNDGRSPSEPGELRLSAVSPVRSSPAPANDCAIFDVTIRNLSFQRGELVYLDTEALRTDGTVLNALRRTGEGGVLPDTELPPGGALVAETGICWPPQPLDTPTRIRVSVEVDPGDRRATLTLPVHDWRDDAPE